MHVYLPYSAGLLLAAVPGALGQQPVDPLSDLVSQALSVATNVVSILSVQATATPTPTPTTTSTSSTSSTSSSSSSTSPSSTSSSSTSSSSLTTTSTLSSQTTTSTQSASDTAAAAASSSAAAAIAATDAQNSKSRTTAIALGVVLGLLGLALLIGLLLFCLRRRRRQRVKSSRRSISSEDLGGANWGKEPLGNSSTVEHIPPNRLSTHEQNHTPLGAGAPLMAENALHRHSGNSAFGNDRPVPHRVAPEFQPGNVGVLPAGRGAHHSNQNYIPLSSHSRSGTAAAGLGGAAMGGLAARNHHDGHHHRGFGHHHNNEQDINSHQHLSRKPVGAAFAHGASDQPLNMGIKSDAAPGYHAGHSISSQGNMANSSQPVRTVDNTSRSSGITNGSPPAYNGIDPSGSSHALSSHPPFADSRRHSAGHDMGTTGATSIGAGALAGAALANRHDGNQDRPDSSLTGRRSWDPNRQPQHPQSILANPAQRRSIGSTNPYVQPREPRRARFSDDAVDGDNSGGHGNGRQQDDLPQNSPYPRMEQSRSPPQFTNSEAWDHSRNGNSIPNQMPGVRPGSGDFTGGNGSGEFKRPPTNRMSGEHNRSPTNRVSGEFNHSPTHRMSGEFNRPANRTSYGGNDASIPPVPSIPAPQSADSRPRNPSLSDLHQQEQNGWYRGRYMGDDVRPVDSATSPATPTTATTTGGGYDDRFYAANRRSVGQAM